MSCRTCPLATTQHSHCQWTELADLFLHAGSGGRLRTPLKTERTAERPGRCRRGGRRSSPAEGKQTVSVEASAVSATVLRNEQHSEGWGRASGHGRETTGVGALVPRANASVCKQANVLTATLPESVQSKASLGAKEVHFRGKKLPCLLQSCQTGRTTRIQLLD